MPDMKATVTGLYESAVGLQRLADPRAAQGDAGILGPSDIGFCRNQAALTIVKAEKDPLVEPVSWPLFLGTAIHKAMADVLKAAYPDWLVDEQRVTATLPSGVEISGTPDVIAPDLNAILDLKTVDGLAWNQRNGISRNHEFQRHLYAIGAVQAGLLDDTKPLYVGNVYLDRSGKEGLYVSIAEFDPSLTQEIDSWVEDVIYAVKHNEPAPQDIAPSVCERICRFWTACRGGVMPDSNDPEYIGDNEEAVTAVQMYLEGKAMAKEGERLKKSAQVRLLGINGTDGENQIRWTSVPDSDVPGFHRKGYDRLDIRPLKKGK